MQADQQSELLDLLSALCDDRLGNEEGERLAAMLRQSSDARWIYVRYVDLHGSLHRETAVARATTVFSQRLQREGIELELGVGDHPSSLDLANQFADRSGEESSRRFVAMQTGVAAIATAILVGVFAWWMSGTTDDRPAAASRNVVAQIVAEDNCKWQGETASTQRDRKLQAGEQLTLEAGLARMRFNDQTVVLVESPATFEVVSESSLRLHSGTVALRANGPKKDFVVLAPNASIVDRGTSFGVHCGPEGIDIEVFEGTVEVHPGNDAERAQVLGLGASARVRDRHGKTELAMFAGEEGQFTDLLQLLWEDMDMRQTYETDAAHVGPVDNAIFPRAEFSGDGSPIDRFHGAARGNGWVTPWLGSGSPMGELAHDGALTGPGNPYLRVRFYRSNLRTIAREYGATRTFDPAKPHVISWVFRFDGEDKDFGDSFRDRIAFYGNPYFRANSSQDVTWFIGWVGDHEKRGARRKAIPKRWTVFDGATTAEFGLESLVDTGMELKPGVVYRMAVVLYPKLRQYDAIIQDDQQTVVHRGLAFRNRQGQEGRVVHFSVGNTPPDGDACFSIDSIRIETLRPELISKDLRFNIVNDPANPPALPH